MSTLKKLKTVFTAFKKQHRPILTNACIDKDGLHITDLETFITIKNTFDLSKGLHPLNTITLLNKPISEDDSEFPCKMFSLGIIASYTVSVKQLEELEVHTSKDETRMHLNCIAFDKNDIVACDGHTLKNIKSLIHELPEHEQTFLIPRTVIKHIIKLAKIYKLNEVELKFSEEHVTINTNNFIVSGRLLIRDYVKWCNVLPNEESLTECFTVNQFINLKNLKPLFNIRGTCKLFSKDGKVYLTPCESVGSGEEFEIGTSDKDFEIGFNVNLLNRVLTERELKVRYINATSPCAIFNKNTVTVIMPLKL